ncbi:MAG TPA: LysM peptidoglycan-binding domain-containing protein [Polyangiaceae bacterium]
MTRRAGRVLGILAFILLSAEPALPAQRIHTVVNGQTLGAIAKRYGVSVDELRDANQLTTGVRLKVGQRLLVPSPGEMSRFKRVAGRTTATEPVPASNPSQIADNDGAAAEAEATAAAPQDASKPLEAEASKPDEGAGTSSESSRTADALPEPDAPPAFPDEPTSPPSHRVDPPRRTNPRTAIETPTSGQRKSKAIEHRTHTVAEGHTLGKLAKRYHIKVESLCSANGIRRNERLKLGQELIIPNGDDDPVIESGPPMSEERDSAEHHSDRESSGVK